MEDACQKQTEISLEKEEAVLWAIRTEPLWAGEGRTLCGDFQDLTRADVRGGERGPDLS
jgi:hypothetical protein